jgi:signal transduction histidine kinase
VRALAHGLIPVPIDANSLPAALNELASSTQQISGLTCRFECRETVKVSDFEPPVPLRPGSGQQCRQACEKCD